MAEAYPGRGRVRESGRAPRVVPPRQPSDSAHRREVLEKS